MNFPFLIRHWIHYWSSAFFFSFIFCDIDDFILSPSILDHIGHHQFNNFSYLPNVQQDYQYNNLTVDGSIPVAISSFKFPQNKFQNIHDTLKLNHSFFSYRQGDYLYRDLIVNKSMYLQDSLEVKFLGQTRSFPGPYNNLGSQIGNSKNVLQNYFLSFQKHYLNQTKFYIDYFYHRENIGLPITSPLNTKQYHEANLFSIGQNFERDKIELKSNLSIQNGNLESQNHSIEYLTVWSKIYLQKSISPSSNLYLNYNFKGYNIEFINSNTLQNNVQKISSGLNLINKNNSVKIGINSINNKIFGYFNLNTKFKNSNLSIYYEPRNFYNLMSFILDSINISENLLTFYGMDLENSFLLNKTKFDWNVKYIGFKTQTNQNFIQSKFKIDHHILNLKFTGFNSLYNKANQQYYNAKIRFKPIITWDKLKELKDIPIFGIVFWNEEKRYIPFVELDFHYADWVQSGFNELGQYELIELPQSQFWWDFSFGFNIQNFNFTWNYNFLSNEFLHFSISQLDSNNSNLVHPIGTFSYFQIDWRFLD